MSGARIDWGGLMRAGLHGLGLSPAEFWCLTPVELRLMLGLGLGPGAGAAALTRARLEELVRAFPDGCRGDEDGDGSG